MTFRISNHLNLGCLYFAGLCVISFFVSKKMWGVCEFMEELQLVENDKGRNGNREALTALRKRARTTKTSILSPFESIMREIGGPESRPLVKEVCSTCGNHDSSERTWMMFPGTDVFARIPFHASHTILETGHS